MKFTVAKMDGGMYNITKKSLIQTILANLKNENYKFSHIIVKKNLSSPFYIDIDNFYGFSFKDVMKTIKQVLSEYYGNVGNCYILKSCSKWKFHIYFYDIIVSRNTGLFLIRKINTQLEKPVLDELSQYATTIRFEGSCKYDTTTKTHITGTNYVLIRGSIIDNISFYEHIFNYGASITTPLKNIPQILNKNKNNKKNKNKSKNINNKNKNDFKDLLNQVKYHDISNKLTIEIKCKNDILKAIPNTNEYYQSYPVWWAIGIACKRVGISRVVFENWTGATAIGWSSWNISKKGYGYNFLMTVARKCSNVVNGTNVIDFLQADTKPHITYNSRYCRPILFNDMTPLNTSKHDISKDEISQKATVLDAICGTGKTFTTTSIINRYQWNSILILTPRITFADSIYDHFTDHTQYDFDLYKNTDISNSDYVICSMESIHKLNGRTFELVIIDEVESNLYQFNSPHMTHISHCQNTLHNILTTSNRILCLDSFINPNRSIKLLKQLDINFCYIKNTFKYDNITVESVKFSETDLLQMLRENILKQNKKIYAVIPNKSVVKKIYNTLQSEFNEKNKNIKVYHGDLTKAQKKISNVNNEWIQYDLIITTLTITVGIDFTVDHFDFGFVWGDSSCGLPRDLVQCMLRARKLKKWILNINASTYTGFSPCFQRYYVEFEEKTKIIQSFMVSQNKSNVGNVSEWLDMPEWLRDLYFTNVYEQDLSKLYYKLMLQYFLAKLGITHLKNYDYNFVKIKYVSTPWDDIDTIDTDQYEQHKKLLKNNLISEFEYYELQKYILLNSGFVGNYPLLWKDWIKNHSRFDNIKSELNNNIWDVYQKNIEKHTYIERSTLIFKQFEIIKQFQTKFGFKNTLDYEWRILGKKLDTLMTEIVSNDKKYSQIFSVKNCREKSQETNRKKCLETFNKYLKAWGMNKIVCLKKIQIRVNKKRVYKSDLFEYGFETKYNLTYQKPATKCMITVD